MAVNPIITTPPPSPGGPNVPINPDEIKQVIDQTNKLNESLKTITQTLKDIAEADAFGKLEDKLEAYGKKLIEFDKIKNSLNKLNTEITDKESSILNSNNQRLKDALTIIKNGIDARRKLGEEITNLNEAQSLYNQAESTGNRAAKKLAKDRLDSQARKVDGLRQEAEKYKELIVNEQSLTNLVGQTNVELVQKLIKQKNLKESYKDYINNHEDEIELLETILSKKEKEKAKHLAMLEQFKQEDSTYKGILQIKKEIVSLFQVEKFTLTAIVQEAFKLDKLYNEHAKQLGISKTQVHGMAKVYSLAGASAGTLASYGNEFAQTQKNILEASTQLNDALGTAAFYSKERLQDQVFLTKELGLDVKAATAVQHLSIVSAKTNKQIVDSVNNQVIALGKQKGIYLDNRKILSDVAQVSGQLAAQYKNNPDLLAKAVIQAKELGLTLEQTAKMGDKLLDFPGSIESELKAELLTGKALNLEQARYLTLMGDSAGAAKELMNNVGGLSEFQKLNVLQQRALAEAVGLQAGELADSLKTQELLNQTGDKSIEALNERRRLAIENGQLDQFYADLRRAGTSEEMIANQAQLAQQDKMNYLIDKLSEGLSSLIQPALKIVDAFSSLVKFLGGAKGLLTIIAGIIGTRIAYSIAASVIQLRMMNMQLIAQQSIQNGLSKILKTNTALQITSTGFATWGVGLAVIGGLITAALAAYGLSGEFSGSPSGGGGISPSNINNMNTSSEKPIQVTLNNETRVGLGNRDIAYVSTSQQQAANTTFDRTG